MWNSSELHPSTGYCKASCFFFIGNRLICKKTKIITQRFKLNKLVSKICNFGTNQNFHKTQKEGKFQLTNALVPINRQDLKEFHPPTGYWKGTCFYLVFVQLRKTKPNTITCSINILNTRLKLIGFSTSRFFFEKSRP